MSNRPTLRLILGDQLNCQHSWFAERGDAVVGALWRTIQEAGAASFGEAQAERFVRQGLPHFGRFQDAMSGKAWRLFHSLAGARRGAPVVSSAAYVDRMSDYCKGCHYDKKARTGERACPYNALYWDFFDRNRDRLAGNHRLGMVYQQLRKMRPEALEALRAQARHTRDNLERL